MKRFLLSLPIFCIRTIFMLALALAAIVLGLRYWLLPGIETYRPEIVGAISRAAGTQIAIGGLRAEWGGLRPRLALDNVQVFDSDGNPALELVKVDATIAWRSIFAGALRLHSLEIIQPSLEIKRDKTGKVFVAGIPMSESEEGGSFNDLVLETQRVYIRDAVLSWEDEFRGKPPLVLDDVSLHLENDGARHRFGLTGKPPAQFAGAIDLRGDLRGVSFDDRQGWSGLVYVEAPYADSDAWRGHLPLPQTFRGGRGGLRLWLNFQGRTIESFVADVKLADVVARLNENLPEMDMASLEGRIRYQARGKGFEAISENLSLVTRGETRTGPTNFLFRMAPKHESPAGETKEATGEFRANRLELAAWASLVDYLPVDKTLKTKLRELAPSGEVRNFAFNWTGQSDAPIKYQLVGRIARGAVNAFGDFPGVAGLTADINANEAGGSLSVESASQLSLPKVLGAPLPIDRLTVQANWKHEDGYTDIRLGNVAFANAHLAGSASGTYRAVPEHRGHIDLSLRLDRAEGSHAALYVPLMAGQGTRAWLERAILGAKVSEGAVRIVGDLANFPFADDKNGQFLINLKFSDGVLNYAESWPLIEKIRGEVTLHGRHLEVKASEGAIFGTKLKDVVATVADVHVPEASVEVTGEAGGAVAEKIRFINQSPVKAMLGDFAEGVAVGGKGKLDLKLSIPVRDAKSTRVNGRYQFQRASLQLSGGAPPVAEINGVLQFSESGVSAQNVATQILGGPASVSLSTRPDKSIAVEAKGNANVDMVRAFIGHPALKLAYGKADWQGRMDIRKGNASLTVTSPLVGVTSDLPPPLRKTYAQEMPLKLEQHWDGGKPERIRASLGDVVFGEFERIDPPGAEPAFLKRGVVSFGKPAALPSSDGLWVSGNLRTLNIDRWREVLKQPKGSGGGDAIAGVDLTLDSIRAFDRRFSDVHFKARVEGGDWRGSVTGKEMAGNFEWRPAGRGLLNARLKRLLIPDEIPGQDAPAGQLDGEIDFPALDIVAEELQIRSKRLGRLELKAEQQGRDWRIEKLKLAQAGATLDADGMWSRHSAKPETALKFDLNAPDAGKLLGELGFPDSVKKGEAQLSGTLSWPGAPYEMTPAKLSGHLKLEAKTGQFLKVEPGAGRLLGLMSLQSLPRRITLDFRDIFSDGFAFDDIKGEMRIRDGVLNSKDFTIAGPSALVEMAGDVNLGRETQQLYVKVIPTVGEGVSIATGLLGGPIVGVTAYILQKILKDPISRAVAYEYNVTGTWDNPNVSKLERRVSSPSPSDEVKQ